MVLLPSVIILHMSLNAEHSRHFLGIENTPTPEIIGTPRVETLMASYLKSGQSLFMERAYAGYLGLRPEKESEVSDRRFMVVTTHDGKLLSQRQISLMSLLEMTVNGNEVTLRFHAENAEGGAKSRLKVKEPTEITFQFHSAPDENHPKRGTIVHTTEGIQGIDQGDEVALWLKKVLGKDVRLMMQDEENPRVRGEKAPDFSNLATAMHFHDSYPFTMQALETLATFNRFLLEKEANDPEKQKWPPLALQNWRMNIGVAGEFNEHVMIGKYVQIGEAIFYIQRAKERCPMPAIEQDTAEKLSDPQYGSRYQIALKEAYDLLRIPENQRYREVTGADGKIVKIEKPLMGVDMILVKEGYINVGDEIRILDQIPPELLAA
jgi:uncharacterized protein YcbX